MSHKRIMYHLENFLLIIFAFTLLLFMTNIDTSDKTVNAMKLAKSNNEEIEEEIPEFKIDIELQKLTIKEKETYKITSFIKEDDLSSLENIEYYFKDEKMGKYTTTGEYEVVIIFKDSYKREIEKKTSLTIEINPTTSKKNQGADKKTTTNTTTIKSTTTKTTTKVSLEQQILSNNKKLGTYGRIYFPSLYSVALYRPTTSEEAQKMVDNKDSAAYYKYGNIMVIADHANQGFRIIKSQKVGGFIYIKTLKNGKYVLEKYVVREKVNGKNTGAKLLTNDNRDIGKDVNYSLALYTCNTSDGYSITILLLDRIS